MPGVYSLTTGLCSSALVDRGGGAPPATWRGGHNVPRTPAVNVPALDILGLKIYNVKANAQKYAHFCIPMTVNVTMSKATRNCANRLPSAVNASPMNKDRNPCLL